LNGQGSEGLPDTAGRHARDGWGVLRSLAVRSVARIMRKGVQMGENPIAVRSKKKLTASLSELIEEKSYRDITITELCSRAKLSRPAFYQNFNSMDDILDRLMFERLDASAQAKGLAGNMGARERARVCVDVILDNEQLCSFAVESDTAMNLEHQFAKVISGRAFPDARVESLMGYRCAYQAAGIAAALVAWSVDGRRLERDEIEQLVASFA